MRVEDREQAKAVGVSSRLALSRVKQSCENDPDVGKEMARRQVADELASAPSTTVLPPAAIAALACLRHAEAEYEQARARDWRRSAVSPGAVLPVLFDAVLRARMECRRLGVITEGGVPREASLRRRCFRRPHVRFSWALE